MLHKFILQGQERRAFGELHAPHGRGSGCDRNRHADFHACHIPDNDRLRCAVQNKCHELCLLHGGGHIMGAAIPRHAATIRSRRAGEARLFHQPWEIRKRGHEMAGSASDGSLLGNSLRLCHQDSGEVDSAERLGRHPGLSELRPLPATAFPALPGSIF